MEKDFKGYQRLKNECRSECKQAFNNDLANIISPESKTNPKRFWSFTKARRCDHSGVAPLKSKERIMFSDSQTKASILNSHFPNVFNMTESLDSMKDKGISSHPSMTDIKVSCTRNFKLLRKLDVHKAPGPDGLSPKLLKELADELAPILTLLFQTSLQQGKIPDDWRTADIVPIFKSGEKSKSRELSSDIIDMYPVQDHGTQYLQ